LDDSATKRFRHEMQLVTRMSHPFIVPCKGVGTVAVGAYSVPFYLMPFAEGTMRDILPQQYEPTSLPNRLSVFLRALLGISYMHALGVVHRDLKPENILLFAGSTPRIADFGIAHVAAGVLDVSQVTLPADRLMNRDYYAPEQRYGDATKVDHRADIYAAGCILYELISGIPAVRPSLPTLGQLDARLKPFDAVFARMTAHSPRGRYKHIDLAIDEIVTAMCASRSISDGITPVEELRKKLVKRVRSTNAATREQARDVARQLGRAALPQLHEELGNARLDAALTAYRLVAEIGSEESIPWLIAGLYPRRSSQKLRFPTGEAAAKAIGQYDPQIRLQVLSLIEDTVRPEDIEIVVEDLPPVDVFLLLTKIEKQELFHTDWDTVSPFRLYLKLDEERGWDIVWAKIKDQDDIYTWRILRDVYPHVNLDRKRCLIDRLLDAPSSLSYSLPRVLNAVASAAALFRLRPAHSQRRRPGLIGPAGIPKHIIVLHEMSASHKIPPVAICSQLHYRSKINRHQTQIDLYKRRRYGRMQWSVAASAPLVRVWALW